MRARAAYGRRTRSAMRSRPTLTEPFLDAIDRLLRELNRSRAESEPELLGGERLEQERGRWPRGRTGSSASAAPGSTRRRRAAAPPRTRGLGRSRRSTAFALGNLRRLHAQDHDVVELEALRRVRRRQGQRGVVASQAGETVAGVDAPRPTNAASVGVWRRPGQEGGATGAVGSRRSPLRGRGRGRRQERVAGPSPSPRPGRGARRGAGPRAGAPAARPGTAIPLAIATTTAGDQLPVRPGQHGPGRVVVGPRRPSPGPGGPGRPPASGARTSRPSAAGPGPDALGEPLRVVLDESDRPLDDRRRAAVVDLEVDPAQSRQRRVEAQHPPDVGQPPAVDGLVVVTDQQDPVRRRREQQRQPELGPVHVLDLVDQQVGAPRRAIAPSEDRIAARAGRSRGGRGRRSRGRPTLASRALVVDEGARERTGLRIGRDLVHGDARARS